MKTFILFILFPVTMYAQSETKVMSISTFEHIDEKNHNVYNKKTGVKLTEEEFIALVKLYPRLVLEKVINKYGKVEKKLFDPDHIDNSERSTRNEELQPQKGDIFSEFVFKDVNGKVFESAEIKDRNILVRFSMFAKFEQKHVLEELSRDLKGIPNCIAFVCFAEEQNDDLKQLSESFPNLIFISGGNGFHEKYQIRRTTNFILDKKGIVLKKYEDFDMIRLKDIVKD